MSDITPERLQELLQFSESDIIAAIGEMELHSILTELQRLRQTQARIERAYKAGFDFAMLTNSADADLAAENARLREALEPFSEAGKAVEGAFGPALFPDDAIALGCTWAINGERRSITWADFRRARAALSQEAPK